MSRTRTDYAEGDRYGKHIINEIFHIVECGKGEWKWMQTVDGEPHELCHFISEKNMRDKMKEKDFYFERK